MKKQLNVPHFKNEQQEHDFWANINLADYYEANDAQEVSLPNLKPTLKSISIRLPESLLNRIKEQANEMDVPYQSLIKSSLNKTFLAK